MAESIATLTGDAESSLIQTQPVVIYAPQRNRTRFPENCVVVHVSEAEARAAAKPDENRHAAIATGPSRSSEGFRLYYLVRWLD